MPRRERVVGGLLALLGIAVLTLTVVVVHLAGVVRDNRAQVRQLASGLAVAQQDARGQQQLVQALRRQVRSLGAEPLTTPPTPRTDGGTTVQPTGPQGATPAPRPTPPPRSTPPPSPSPRPSSSPQPSPSLCVPGITCVPIAASIRPTVASTRWLLA